MQDNSNMSEITTKKPEWWLVIGIILLPIIFAWFTLRKGFGKKTRIVSFGWMVIFLLAQPTGDKKNDNVDVAVAAEVLGSSEQEVQNVENKHKSIDIGNAKGTVVNGIYVPYMPERTKPKTNNSYYAANNNINNIDKSVFIPYDRKNNKKVFEQYGSRMQDIQPLREQMARKAITSGKCERVRMSEVKLDEDINHLVLFVFCSKKDGNDYKEIQIYASESDLK